mgnify:FL=1
MNFNKLTDCYTLSNGVKIPCIGYGTWQTPDDVAAQSVQCALQNGYRHIDTAAAYGNEKSVGEGIRRSGVKREDIFVTTKHWIDMRGYEKTIQAFETSLMALGLDYLDLYLIHWPSVARRDEKWEWTNAETWRGFEKMYKDGKLRALGVSNFEKKHLDSLIKNATVKPMVNQLEYHPGYLQQDTVDYSKQLGMVVEAWSPLGSGAVLKHPVLVEMAQRYGKSVAQLCIRFALQSGVLPLPKSVTPARIEQNTQVFDFTISEEDMAIIRNMDRCGFSGFLAEEAPADALVWGEV